jgi:hypothetical protein
MENTNQLNSAIIQTMVRFDLFAFPLTSFEIWQFLDVLVSYEEVLKSLDYSLIEKKQGFYFLPNRSNLIITRQERYREAEAKIKLAQIRLKLISWLPNIKLICLANIIGPHNLKPETDLDLFIVTKTNRLWFVKFLATIILKITNLRPTAKNSTNKLCLSFLVDESALDLTICRLNNNDWYFTYWLSGLMPLYGDLQAYKDLITANSWLKQSLPNWQLSPYTPINNFKLKLKSTKAIRLLNSIEKLSHKLHELVMGQDLKNSQNKSTAVIITDHVLKLHTTDRRKDFFKLVEEKMANL